MNLVLQKNRYTGAQQDAQYPVAKNLTQLYIEVIPEVDTFPSQDSIPSLQVLLDIINPLEYSADDLLFMDVERERQQRFNWLCELSKDYDQKEIKLIFDTVLAMKSS